MMFLTGCVSGGFDCPEPTEISEEDQAKAEKELQAIPPGSSEALMKVLAASLDDRDKIRACRQIR
jgi:hypothetical protein